VIPKLRNSEYMTAYNILTLPETILFDCNSRDPINTMYPGKIRAIEEADNELKQNKPRGGIDPNALARNDVTILALISKTLLYNDDCLASTSCNNARMIPNKKANGISIHRAPNANGPTQTDANPYMRMTTQRRYKGGFLTISSRSREASSTPITSWMTPLYKACTSSNFPKSTP